MFWRVTSKVFHSNVFSHGKIYLFKIDVFVGSLIYVAIIQQIVFNVNLEVAQNPE